MASPSRVWCSRTRSPNECHKSFSPAVLSLIPVVVILNIVRALDDGSTGWAHVVRFLEFQPARWDVVGGLLISVACSLVTAAVLVRVRDF
jgi:hypothetical protein